MIEKQDVAIASCIEKVTSIVNSDTNRQMLRTEIEVEAIKQMDERQTKLQTAISEEIKTQAKTIPKLAEEFERKLKRLDDVLKNYTSNSLQELQKQMHDITNAMQHVPNENKSKEAIATFNQLYMNLFHELGEKHGKVESVLRDILTLVKQTPAENVLPKMDELILLCKTISNNLLEKSVLNTLQELKNKLATSDDMLVKQFDNISSRIINYESNILSEFASSVFNISTTLESLKTIVIGKMKPEVSNIQMLVQQAIVDIATLKV